MFEYLTTTQRATTLPVGRGAIASIALHALLIGGAAYERSRGPADEAESWDEIPEGLTYIAPPNIASSASQVQIRYESSGGAEGNENPTDRLDGTGGRVRGVGPGANAVASVSGGDEVPDQIAQPTEDPFENAFSSVEVEQQAARDPASAAPVYPAKLMSIGIEGYAAMRFVVDSAGHVDMESVRVLDFTNIEFVVAVRNAMPRMMFTPARLGDRPVRQLAEQMFRFQIEKPPISGPATASSVTAPRIPVPQE